MNLLNHCRNKVAGWSYTSISILAGLAAFGCYTSMYAFRKAFTAGTFEGHEYLGVDYKVWLVIAQVLGYTFSKFYGIRFIAESSGKNRGRSILKLIGVSWMALLGFAIVPAPWNIAFLFINGFPLGMIWGLVFSYLEGRKNTEFMGAVMSVSLIFASGFIKTVARTLMSLLPVNEYWMPFCTGLLFVVPMLLFVAFLEMVPPPTEEDQRLRTKRLPMNGSQRKKFLLNFLPGVILTIVIYVVLTVIRDLRDNFEVEIWHDLGVTDNHIYAQIDGFIALVVLSMVGLLILVRNNLKAFIVIHWMIIGGCALTGIATLLFDAHYISPVVWMCMVGMGLYMAYIPYNAIFFERMIATFNYKSNIGFIMYVSDAIGYLGSVSILLVKEFGDAGISWGHFFRQSTVIAAVVGVSCSMVSLLYFRQKSLKNKKKESNITLSALALDVKGGTE